MRYITLFVLLCGCGLRPSLEDARSALQDTQAVATEAYEIAQVSCSLVRTPVCDALDAAFVAAVEQSEAAYRALDGDVAGAIAAQREAFEAWREVLVLAGAV